MKRLTLILIILSSSTLYSCKKNNLAELPPDTNTAVLSPKQLSKEQEKKSLVEPKLTTKKLITPSPTSTLLTNTSDVDLNSVSATVFATETSILSFRVNGYIDSIYVKNGDFIKKGQIIAKLDDSITTENFKSAQLSLEQAKTTAHFADLTLKRTETLNAKQATTQIALEQAQAADQNAKLAIQQAETNLKLAQINLNYTKLQAPFDGYIFNLSTWTGSYQSSTTPVVTLTSVNNLQIQIPIPQTIKNNYKVGDHFKFSSPNQGSKGIVTITSIIPYVDPNTKTYLLIGTPEELNGDLLGGELVIVKLK